MDYVQNLKKLIQNLQAVPPRSNQQNPVRVLSNQIVLLPSTSASLYELSYEKANITIITLLFSNNCSVQGTKYS